MKPELGSNLAGVDPATVRESIRNGLFRSPTAGLAPGFVQAILVILPVEHAFHFLLFCQRNPKPCPVLDVLEEGAYESRRLAPGSDIRVDFPAPGFRRCEGFEGPLGLALKQEAWVG
jgi:uncharacterized protein YcsI (UPF0317 family)